MPYFKVKEESGTKKLIDYSMPPVPVPFSHIGQIIESTTLDTLAKVQAIYGSNTTWIQHTGYMLRGATSGVTADQAQKDGGSDDATLVSHSHTFTGSQVTSGGASVAHTHTVPAQKNLQTATGGTHNHALKSNTVHYGGSGINLSTGGVGFGGYSSTPNGDGSHYHTFEIPAIVTGGDNNGHTHAVTAAGTNSTEGSSGTNANIPNYKNVYIWERTA